MATNLCFRAGETLRCLGYVPGTKKSPPKELVPLEALAFHKINGNQEPTLEVGSVQLLAIPAQTKLAAASPFHGYSVSPGSKRVFLRTL